MWPPSIYLGRILRNKTTFFFLVSLFFTLVFFRGVNEPEFLLVGDQFFRLSFYETFINSFFLRKLSYLGSYNGWQMSTQSLDILFYLLIYSLKISYFVAEKIVVFLSFFVSLNLAYIGFSRISKMLGLVSSNLAALVVTFWYCFNPYTLELWHGGVFNIGLAMTYSLAPLTIFYVHELLNKRIKKYEILLLSVILMLSSFTFWLFAPFALALVLFVVFSPRALFSSIRGFLVLLASYVLLALPIVFAIVFEYFDKTSLDTTGYTPVYGNQQGGVWYQILMYFSWGIYTVWHPRTLYPFGPYFFSTQYILATCLVYVVALFGLFSQYRISKKIKPFLVKVFVLLLAALFFAKGAQPPLGEIFEYLYKNVPLFGVFRTPDIRFGFVIVLALAVFLLNASKFMNKKIFAILVAAIIAFQVPHFFTGEVFRGRDVEGKYFDRIVEIPESYKEVSEFLNSDEGLFFVFPLPNAEFGNFVLGPWNNHLGQDILPKAVMKPFLYGTYTASASKRMLEEVERVIQEEDFNSLSNFPVKYLVLRSDVVCTDCDYDFDFDANFHLRFENNTFKVYEIPGHRDVVEGASVSYEFINPVKFRLSFKNLSETELLSLYLSFDKNWKLYAVPYDGKFGIPKEVFAETHEIADGYANSWKVDPMSAKEMLPGEYFRVNADGSIDFDLVLYYVPQFWFDLARLISYLGLFAVVVVIFKLKKDAL